MHEYVAVHVSMSTLTKHRFVTSEQHVECGETRQARDAKDVKAIIE